jgi:hypothetical protein
MGTAQSTKLLNRLNLASLPYRDPLARVDWEHLDRDRFWLPESALSLYGTEAYETLALEQRRRLSHYEFLHIMQAGVWVEGLLMERISRDIGRYPDAIERVVFRLHELREEAGHSLMFLELIRRYDRPVPPSAFQRLSLPNLLGRFAPFRSVMFWAAVWMGEEITDRVNRTVRHHRESISRAVYDIVSVHMVDEARHIAAAQDTIETGMARIPAPLRPVYARLLSAALQRFVTLLYYPPPTTYTYAGLDPNVAWVNLARQNPNRRAFIQAHIRPTLEALAAKGLSLSFP